MLRTVGSYLLDAFHFTSTRCVLFLSPSFLISGLRVSIPFASQTERDRLLADITASIDLIGAYDPKRLQRMRSDVHRILLVHWPLEMSLGYFTTSPAVCHINASVFDSEKTGRVVVGACVLVHEATHARLYAAGIRPAAEEDMRIRMERTCLRAQLAFASTLPSSERLQDVFATSLLRSSDDYSDREVRRQRRRSIRVVWRELGRILRGESEQ